MRGDHRTPPVRLSPKRPTWQASVGRWADAGGRRGPRGGDLTSTGMRTDAGDPRDGRLQCRWRRGRRWLARALTKGAARAAR